MFNFISKFYKDYQLMRLLKTIDADMKAGKNIRLELADQVLTLYQLKYKCDMNGIPYIVKFNHLLIINPTPDQLQKNGLNRSNN